MNEAEYNSVFQYFTQTVRQVCGEMERFSLDNTPPLLSALIRLLHDADKLTRSSINFSDGDFNAEVPLPQALRSIPDDLLFHVMFDPLNQESACASSLRDSLGDIYQALKPGLDLLDENPTVEESVLWAWRQDYETHWGRHLLDVIRFLFLCPRNPGD